MEPNALLCPCAFSIMLFWISSLLLLGAVARGSYVVPMVNPLLKNRTQTERPTMTLQETLQSVGSMARIAAKDPSRDEVCDTREREELEGEGRRSILPCSIFIVLFLLCSYIPPSFSLLLVVFTWYLLALCRLVWHRLLNSTQEPRPC